MAKKTTVRKRSTSEKIIWTIGILVVLSMIISTIAPIFTR